MRADVADVLAARTRAWSADERATLAAVVEALRPSPRHLTDILDWIDDVVARDGIRPGAVLADPDLARALAAPGSAPDRLKRWKACLRRRRYPRLAAREQRFAELARALDLGPAVTVAPPADLEGGEVTVTLRARSAADLDTVLGRLRARLDDGRLAELFALLDEV